jgi:hypothetical protein
MDDSPTVNAPDQASQPGPVQTEEAPQYDGELPPPAYGETATSVTVPRPSPSLIAGQAFPFKWNVYSKATPTELVIAESPENPLYYLSRSDHSGWKSRSVILYDGISAMNSVLASGRYTDGLGETWQIKLPPAPGQTSGTVETVSKGNWNRGVFKFSVETAIANQRESFEWRTSSNSQLSTILGGHVLGWKLVRMTNDAFTAEASAAAGVKTSWPMTTDGKEIIGVCTICARNHAATTKYWTHAFLGTGKSGVLGKTWQTMAAMTSLMLMDYQLVREHVTWYFDSVH